MPLGFSAEGLPPWKALRRHSRERTFAALGLAWREAKLFARQSLT
jgi:hypothetical protein